MPQVILHIFLTSNSLYILFASSNLNIILRIISNLTVIVDSDGSTCSMAAFTFGGDTYTRSYDIKVRISIHYSILSVSFHSAK